MRQLQEMLTTGGAELARNYLPVVTSHCLYQGAQRAARLAAYSLIRQLSSLVPIDWQSVTGIAIQDS